MDVSGVIRTMAQLLADSGGRLYLACSGGLDSMALGSLLHESVVGGKMAPFEVLHVNYGLRGSESDGDQALVEKVFTQWGYKVRVLDLRGEKPPGKGVQEWARQKRYSWFQSILAENDYVALAHHQGDLAENLLFRLSRGVGSSLLGMGALQGPYWRPLLGVSKAELEGYVSGQNVPYRHDSSNDKLIYSRNRIRHRVLPELDALFQGAEERMVETAKDIDEILAFFDKSMSSLVKGPSLTWSVMDTLPQALGRRLITEFIKSHDDSITLERNQLKQIWSALSLGESYQLELGGPKQVKVEAGSLELLDKKSGLQRQSQYEAQLRRGWQVLLPPNGRLNLRQGQDELSLKNDSSRPVMHLLSST